jgi:murein L,D-transpeptidase YafK
MKGFLKFILLFTMSTSSLAQSSFKEQQLKFERVRTAYDQKWDILKKELSKEVIKGDFNIYIAAYKSEGKLEIWLQKKPQKKYKLFKTYDFSAHSGTLGPKVKQGDLQTPEGFYNINVFNPKSNYYLSLGINYPNNVDLQRSGRENPGNDIYIHGNRVTIGCIPLTDEKIKEVYVLAIEARNNGQQQIPVHIFPFKMTEANLKKYTSQYPKQIAFWQNLQAAYAYFKKHNVLPSIHQDKGRYLIKKEVI